MNDGKPGLVHEELGMGAVNVVRIWVGCGKQTRAKAFCVVRGNCGLGWVLNGMGTS
jgi:hypothetical protein